MKLFSLNQYSLLALGIAKTLGTSLSYFELSHFANNETRILIDESVKNENIFLIFNYSENVNQDVLNYCLLIDAVKRMNPKTITAIIPWLPYSAQDKVFRPGEPLSSKIVIQMFELAGVDNFITFDLHSLNNFKFFSRPVYELSAISIYKNYFQDKMEQDNCSVVSYDAGSLPRAQLFANELGLKLIKLTKSRNLDNGEVTFSGTSGELEGKITISFDDFTSTGSTRILGARLLKAQGVITHYDCVTHVLVRETLEKIQRSSAIDHFFMTDTTEIYTSEKYSKVKQMSVTNLIASKIKEIAVDN